MLENDVSAPAMNTTIYLKEYQVPDFLISQVDLEFVLSPDNTRVKSRLKVTRNGAHDRALTLCGEKLTLISVAINDESVAADAYEQTDMSLKLPAVPNEFELVIETEIAPQQNTELSGLYRSSGNYCTQCEAEGFRRITYFLDRPDVLAEYRVRIVAPKAACPVLLSNGNPVAQGDGPDGLHWAQWHDPHPKPSYLFALVAGDLQFIEDQFTTMSGRDVALKIYTQSAYINKCAHAMASLKRSMAWDERVYGREYDLDIYNIVAVDDFNMGAMENKGLNVFNTKYVLADTDTATDADYEAVESVIAHEYFHNWSGNRVTCRDWFQLSLKEGFTVFRDQEYSADLGSRAVKRIQDVQVLRAFQFKEDSGPMAHPIRPDSYQEINNFYTATVYQKGAEVIRMLHRLLGADAFRRGTDLYFADFDGQAVTTEDFVHALERASGVDLTQFRRWYSQAGTPIIKVEQHFGDGVLTLSLQQSCPDTPGQTDKLPFHMPIEVALFSPDGKKLVAQTLSFNQAEQQFRFDNLACKPVVSVLRYFSAPVKLEYKQSNADRLHLIKYEDDGFVRWESMQQLCLAMIQPALTTGELDPRAYQRVRDAFEALMTDPNPSDKAVLAEMLTLPPAAYIAELASRVDPAAISAVRDRCIERLAKDLEKYFHALYADNNTALDTDAQSLAARRMLKNRALFYLVETGQTAYYALASHQYHAASNMTDRLAAFTALVQSHYPDRDALISDFYETWQHEPLVLDKWFAIQAMRPSSEALREVEDLLHHSDFTLTNPNRVRSVLGAFSGNLAGFHRLDGKGYALLVDYVIKLDQINPQIAARLVSSLNSWRRFTEPYASRMRTELARLNMVSQLSSDVREVVSKALSV
ncbi:aminopeptidase N [Arenicella chitinivorans]|uniref:Aminopeptidase N n=1 Tax=Arenicella chitinivorans TaxID=1329800 RepID=A0A918RZ86_9GAMM|nr:aminopeptidase N [Arenicella chitinivorans]GHA14451.1 aminopeptidase N [Arenicella chitinivorans]